MTNNDIANPSEMLQKAKSWRPSLPTALFGVCILIYLVIRMIGLTDYPVYFTFDEANPTLLASDFIRDGLRDVEGDLFPAFFPNDTKYNLGTTVYIQLVPLLIFGRSEYVIRFTSVLVGLIGVICVSLALRDIFHARYWWAGVLVLSAIPAWFHHSRTGYEMPTFVSFYSAMLYCYWLYRSRNPNYLYLAVICASLAFYAYAPGQAIVPLTILILLIIDFPYHLRMRIPALGSAGLGVLCVLPYVRFQLSHAGHSAEVLGNVGSYWAQDIPLIDKIIGTFNNYLFHLNPLYWFTPAYEATRTDGLLHIMKGYGHLGFLLLPFFAWGLWLLVRRLRQPEYRVLLVALLVAPVGAALVLSPSSITRGLVMVIPAALIGSIGLDDLLGKLVDRIHLNRPMLAHAALLVVLFSVNAYMLWDVLTNGISWFDKNQADGVQFGASKVFPAVQEQMKVTPNAFAVISPNWAMFEDLPGRIYLGDNANIVFNSTYDYAAKRLPLENDTFFVVTPEEFDFANSNPKFSDIQVLQVIPYSSTKVGFYVIRLKYSPQADALLAAEDAEKRKLIPGEVMINGQKVQVKYTQDDGLPIQNVFDDDPESLYKTAALNPALFDLTFPQEQEFHSIFIIHGGAQIELKVTFFSAAGDEIKSYTTQFLENGDKGNTLNFDQTVKATRVVISVQSILGDANATVHIWEIAFNK